jgi:hypothetical protein
MGRNADACGPSSVNATLEKHRIRVDLRIIYGCCAN